MTRTAVAFVLVLLAAPALASTDEAWEAFRKAVHDTCLALVESGGTVEVEVNPFGSETYGAATVTVTSEGEGTQRMICIYDKAAGTAELTAPF